MFCRSLTAAGTRPLFLGCGSRLVDRTTPGVRLLIHTPFEGLYVLLLLLMTCTFSFVGMNLHRLRSMFHTPSYKSLFEFSCSSNRRIITPPSMTFILVVLYSVLPICPDGCCSTYFFALLKRLLDGSAWSFWHTRNAMAGHPSSTNMLRWMLLHVLLCTSDEIVGWLSLMLLVYTSCDGRPRLAERTWNIPWCQHSSYC